MPCGRVSDDARQRMVMSEVPASRIGNLVLTSRDGGR